MGGAIPLGWLAVHIVAVGLPGSQFILPILAGAVSYGAVCASLAAGTVWVAKRAPELSHGPNGDMELLSAAGKPLD